MLNFTNAIFFIANAVRNFSRFSLISGFGWLLDIFTYLILTKHSCSPELSNFLSSFVGITFVWFVSLSTLFKSKVSNHGYSLLMYWGFQFISIFIYSKSLKIILFILTGYSDLGLIFTNEIIAKILITPLNLITNYLFLRFLISHANKES
jgi:putative flippase GtrA